MSNRANKIQPVQLFFLTYVLQASVAIFTMPLSLSEAFGTNAWVVLPLFSAVVMFNIYLFQLVYKKGNGASIFDIMQDALPKVIRVPIYAGIALIWSLDAILIAKQYVHILQTIAFPTTPAYSLLIVFLVLVLLYLKKPLYKMVQAAVILFGLSLITILLTVFIWNEFAWTRMTPFILKEADPSSNWLTMVDQYYPFLGFEICLFLFPYVTKNSHLFRSFYLGNAFTTFIYIYTVILCLGFYSFQQIKHILYPTLTLFSFIEFPFLIRIESLIFSMFLVKSLVTVVFDYWISRLAIEHIVNKKNTNTVLLSLCIIVFSVLVTLPISTTEELQLALTYSGRLRSILIFVFPLFLLGLIYMKKKVTR